MDSPREFAAMAQALDAVAARFPDRAALARLAVAAGRTLRPAAHLDKLEALYVRCRNAKLKLRG